MFATTILLWKKKYYIFWVCVCSPIYPACNAHAPYNVVTCGVCGANIFFPHYLINSTIFGKTLLDTKCVSWFPLQILSQKFPIIRKTQRDIIINVHMCSCKVPVILVRLYPKNCVFSKNFQKNFQIQTFFKIPRPTLRTEIFLVRMDRHVEAKSPF